MRQIPYHLKEMLKFSKSKVVINDLSQGGLSSQSYQWFFTRHYENWIKTRPDFILIQLGTNDVIPLLEHKYELANFEENLKTIIGNFKSFRGNDNKCPEILIASVPLFYGEAYSQEKNRLVKEKINPTIKEIAKKEEIIFVDNFFVLKDKINLYDPDGVHPNSKGEKALAKNWLSWIRSERRKKFSR